MAPLFGTLARQTLKIEFGFGVYRLETVHLIVPANNDIGVVRIDFNAVAPSPGLFGRDQGRTSPGENVENDSPALGAIQNRVGNQRHRLDCRGMASSAPRSLPKVFTPG
jgi:hypothetical protein